MHILGIDPGERTGLAIYSPDQFTSFELHALDVLPFVRGWVTALTEQGRGSETHVAIERFSIHQGTGRKTRQPAALELGQQVRELCALRGAWCQLHDAATSKVYDDALLRRLGGFHATRDGHANDATRLVLLALLRDYPRQLQAVLRDGFPVPVAEAVPGEAPCP